LITFNHPFGCSSAILLPRIVQQIETKQERPDKDKYIGQIKNAGLQISCTEADEVSYPTIADQPVQQVAEASSGNERQGNPSAGSWFGKPQQASKTSEKQQGYTNIEEKEAHPGRQITDDSQKSAMIFNEGKRDQTAEERLFTCMNEDASRHILGDLVAADGAQEEN
jgi:hypothetical protein